VGGAGGGGEFAEVRLPDLCSVGALPIGRAKCRRPLGGGCHLVCALLNGSFRSKFAVRFWVLEEPQASDAICRQRF